MVSIGQNVKRIREEQRYTQTEIARRCGVSHSAIWGLENGEFNPSSPLLIKLARALGVSVEDLVEESTAAPKAPSPPETAHRRILVGPPSKEEEREEGLEPTLHYVNGAVDGLIKQLVDEDGLDRHQVLVLMGKRVEEHLAEETV